MKMRMKITRTALVGMALVVSLVGTGVAYACLTWPYTITSNTVRTQYFSDPFTWTVSNDNGSPQSQSPYGVIDPGDNSLDPNQAQTRGVQLPPAGRYTKDVASTTAVMVDKYNITVTVNNAYPYYYPTIFFGLKNEGCTPCQIQCVQIDENSDTPFTLDDIPDLYVKFSGISQGQILAAGQEVVGTFSIRVEQIAKQNWTYRLKIRIVSCATELGGTPGFWRNNAERFYGRTQILQWIQQIDDSSMWIYDPTGGSWTWWDFLGIIDAASTQREKFLRHYLAFRLNLMPNPPRLHPDNSHDIRSVSGYKYMGVGNPASISMQPLVNAIESKYSPSGPINWLTGWTVDRRYEIMKDICDGLNNLRF